MTFLASCPTDRGLEVGQKILTHTVLPTAPWLFSVLALIISLGLLVQLGLWLKTWSSKPASQRDHLAEI